MKSYFFTILILTAASVSKASPWAYCKGSYEYTVDNQRHESNFYVSIQEDLSYHSVEFTYLFTDFDNGYLFPIIKKETVHKDTVLIQVSFQNSKEIFASFYVNYLNGNIVSLENVMATDQYSGTTVGPLSLTCK